MLDAYLPRFALVVVMTVLAAFLATRAAHPSSNSYLHDTSILAISGSTDS